MDYFSLISLLITSLLIPFFWSQQKKIEKLETDKMKLVSIIYDLINAVQTPHQACQRTEMIKAVKDKLDLLV